MLLKRPDTRVFVIEQTDESVLLNDLSLDANRHTAIVLGNEVQGVQQSVVDLADLCIEIPQMGTKHSLNVSVSAGIVLWSLFKEKRWK